MSADKFKDLVTPENRKRAERARNAKREERQMSRKIREMDFFEDEGFDFEDAVSTRPDDLGLYEDAAE